MATTGDDLENRMPPAKDHGIGSKGGDRNRIGPPPGLAALTLSELGDDASSLWTSWLVPLIVVVNVVIFVVLMFVNNCSKNSDFRRHCFARFLGGLSFEPLHNNPLLGPSTQTFWKLGGLEWSKVVMDHQAWRLLTSIWLHAGMIHIASNLVSLVFIGIRIEQQFGFVRIGVIYLFSRVARSILSLFFIRNTISVGALVLFLGFLIAALLTLLWISIECYGLLKPSEPYFLARSLKRMATVKVSGLSSLIQSNLL